MASADRPALVTGASGFVGRALVEALRGAGVRVRATSRRPRAPEEGVEWMEADVARSGELARALDGAGVAFFLVHGMSGARGDYAEEERRAAATFAREAARSGVPRIVYLGGLAPAGRPSKHLASRLAVGEVLRAGRVPALELRASMIVGAGSASWRVVRDLALRLPAMVLPSWAESRTCPIGIDDVVGALLAARDVPLPGPACLDLPGPEVLSVREILERVAALRGRALPWIRAPLPIPRVSTAWLKLVSDADWAVVRELVVGLGHDLLPRPGALFWDRIDHAPPVSFDEAARRALAGELPNPGLRGRLQELEEAVVQRLGPGLRGRRRAAGPGE